MSGSTRHIVTLSRCAMLTLNDHVTKGTAAATKAIQAKNKKQYSQALADYRIALGHFGIVLQSDTFKELKDKLRPHVQSYIEDAEQLQELLNPTSSSSKSTRSSSSSSSTLLEGDQQQRDEEGDDMLMDRDRQVSLQQIASSVVHFDEKNRVTWDEVIGLEDVKHLLQDIILLPQQMPQLFTGNRKVTRSVLLYGPSGTGKTLLAKALASNANYRFYSISSAEIISKYVGESEKNIHLLFETLRKSKPCILFLDEVEALCTKREEQHHTKSVQQFLRELDGITGASESMEGVFILACTNLPWSLDDAMLRRFERKVYVPLPMIDTRILLLRHYISKNEHILTDEHFKAIALETSHYSSSDISNLTKAAAMAPATVIRKSKHFVPLKDGFLLPCLANTPGAIAMQYSEILDTTKIVVPPITYEQLSDALSLVKSTIDVEKLERYEEWTMLYGSENSNSGAK
jgi:vacuolar protein-sorting-associated protein 4